MKAVIIFVFALFFCILVDAQNIDSIKYSQVNTYLRHPDKYNGLHLFLNDSKGLNKFRKKENYFNKINGLSIFGGENVNLLCVDITSFKDLKVLSLVNFDSLDSPFFLQISKLDSIRKIEISQFKGATIPEELGLCDQFKIIHIVNSDIHVLPASFNKIYELNELNLSNDKNINTEQLFHALITFNKLEKLDISKCNVKFLPKEINFLSGLKEIEISSNNLICLPIEIGNLCNLEYLNLEGNNISELPSEIGNLKKLKYLILIGNNFSIEEKEKTRIYLPNTYIVF
jgi:hypothetical protein